jgi:hypothetical protein
MAAASSPICSQRASRPLGERPSDLDAALSQAQQLIALAKPRSVAFALDQLGDLELSETPVTEDDQALLRSAATLYLAAELEAARLIDAAETLSGLTISGALPIEPGPAVDAITAFWRERNQRFTDDERRAVFVRAFGAEEMLEESAAIPGENRDFFELMLDVCEALYELSRSTVVHTAGNVHAEVRLRTAARALAENMLQHANAMNAFAAEEITRTLSQAVAMLKLPGVQRAFGARSLWSTVSAIARRYWDTDPAVRAHVTRGKAGLTLLSWLADSLPRLGESRQLLVTHNSPVLAAATDWLENSLALRETATAAREA